MLGLSEDDVVQHFDVWPENAETLGLFLRAGTQWRVVAGMGGGQYLGLDYAGVEAMLRLARVPDRRAVFEDLQLMERAALQVLNGKGSGD